MKHLSYLHKPDNQEEKTEEKEMKMMFFCDGTL
jgi:hypothetical protein